MCGFKVLNKQMRRTSCVFPPTKPLPNCVMYVCVCVRDDTENKKGKKNKRKDDDEITIKSLK